MEPVPVPSGRAALSPRFRRLSAAELALGAMVVIGHNVFRVVPNEVPILFFLGLISLRLRDGGWGAMGLRRPASWRRTALLGLAAAATRIVVGEFVVVPLTGRFWPPPVETAAAQSITGNLGMALLALLVVWTFAAFGEEIAYRGYLLTRAADVGNRSRAAYWVGVLLVSVLFGFGHYYKGPAGVIDSGVAGLIFGAVYLLSGRNLWVTILAHGFHDTVAVIFAFFGWD